MNFDERLWAVEEELAANQMKADAIKLTLKAIMNKLELPAPEELVIEEEFNFGQHSGVLVNSKMHTLGHVKIKLATPADFDGDHKNGWAFPNLCNIYFVFCSDLFPNKQAWICWALSFFKVHRAAHFLNKVLWAEVKGKGQYFCNWTTFLEIFTELFCPKNKQLAVLTKLEGTSWYQAKDSVEDYIDWFQELIDVAEYDDDKTIAIKFHKGLDLAIQTRWHSPEITPWTSMTWRVGASFPESCSEPGSKWGLCRV